MYVCVLDICSFVSEFLEVTRELREENEEAHNLGVQTLEKLLPFIGE